MISSVSGITLWWILWFSRKVHRGLHAYWPQTNYSKCKLRSMRSVRTHYLLLLLKLSLSWILHTSPGFGLDPLIARELRGNSNVGISIRSLNRRIRQLTMSIGRQQRERRVARRLIPFLSGFTTHRKVGNQVVIVCCKVAWVFFPIWDLILVHA